MSLSRVQLRLIAGGISGVVFGVGLAVAQMTNPDKVLNFLDLTGTWDASLLLVLGAATGLFAAAYHLIDSGKAPLLDDKFHFPEPKTIDLKLIVGSVLFGIGWGIAGYCPGPAIASLGFENPEALWFVPAMLVGIALQRKLGSAIFKERGAT
jgi:uncharacterized membrane protein YedE/YeeE